MRQLLLQARNQIHDLTEQSSILHLTTAGLPPSDLNKDVKAIIIEELRINPNQKDLKTVVAKIKGVEADHLAVGDKVSIRKTGETAEWKCRICSQTHARGKCGFAQPAKRKVIKQKTVGLKTKEIEAKARTVIKEAGE